MLEGLVLKKKAVKEKNNAIVMKSAILFYVIMTPDLIEIIIIHFHFNWFYFINEITYLTRKIQDNIYTEKFMKFQIY